MSKLAAAVALPRAARVLAGLCDLRLPLTLSEGDCRDIGAVVCEALRAVREGSPAGLRPLSQPSL